LRKIAFPFELSDDSFLRNYEYSYAGYFKEDEASVDNENTKISDTTKSFKDYKITKEIADYLLENTDLDINGWDVSHHYLFNYMLKPAFK